ncbi:hypothetical protein sortregn_7 [Escherichia phage sortregn]|nr:hypothetical protein sortregn_7 [Escherichia phage sortregn]
MGPYQTYRWKYFVRCVADELMDRKLVASREEAEHFAEDLEDSFAEDYDPRPISEWRAIAKKDADDYEKDLKREA